MTSKTIHHFRRSAARRAQLCRELKERAIMVQDFSLAAALRDAQLGFAKHAELYAARKGGIRPGKGGE